MSTADVEHCTHCGAPAGSIMCKARGCPRPDGDLDLASYREAGSIIRHVTERFTTQLYEKAQAAGFKGPPRIDHIETRDDGPNIVITATCSDSAAPPPVCTGIAASWCPVPGDCTCPRNRDDFDLCKCGHGADDHTDTACRGVAEGGGALCACAGFEPRYLEEEDEACPLHGRASLHAEHGTEP